MPYLLRQSRFEQVVRGLEVIIDLAILAGLTLLIIAVWPLISVVVHILARIAHMLGC